LLRTQHDDFIVNVDVGTDEVSLLHVPPNVSDKVTFRSPDADFTLD
jgi:hypothetical protein